LDIESLLIALALIAALVALYRKQRRSDAKDSAPHQFFTASEEDTQLTETRTHSPSELPSPRPPGQRRG
jgi:hypothetical protein